MIKKNKAWLFSVLSLLACNPSAQKENKGQIKLTRKAMRYGSVTGIKPEKVAAYKKIHAAVWPGVLKQIKACNIKNYSIYLKEIDDKSYLFSYFEYDGSNFAADMKKMAADTATQRWWKETAPLQIPLPDAAAKKETWNEIEEVFHQN